MIVAFDFRSSARGFVAGFADYPPATGSGLFISRINRSDDLFMFYQGRAEGLAPNTLYRDPARS